ncbi:hypothetical protein V495_06144 [Pseudogymnoascus sp. VKM F-4514 (FW-929)]|nr:hypothetical protein V490_00756 [Pseudogymnoascus sp. VKM F-3557]KFY39122.1 hypothetical protein V495_06144 [Pseudogymnoascus sp. VKM F-4514 (FW-929)]KFY60449.1 hypothetical protein V497_03627 [Pseudogymnoascus sp. VKM F-4516 (FW-969)]
MKFTLALAANLLAGAAVAAPRPTRLQESSFALEGYAKENPLGETTGGKGGPTTTVTAAAALATAVKGTNPLTIVIKGDFDLPSRLNVGSNKSLIGDSKGATITGAGITIKAADNVIIQNLYIHDILDDDCITIHSSTRIWVDHNEFSSDIEGGPDKFDGQIDIIHASDYVTVSWNYFHDHWKSSLVGNSDANGDEDTGHLHVTYHHNHWDNMGTRGNAGRFGHQHLYSNFYNDFHYQAIHSRSNNQVLVEGNVFRGDTPEALSTYGLVIPNDSPNTSPDGDYEIDGFANLGAENDFGTAGVNITQVGDFTEAPYAYTLTPLASVEEVVKASAGRGKIC